MGNSLHTRVLLRLISRFNSHDLKIWHKRIEKKRKFFIFLFEIIMVLKKTYFYGIDTLTTIRTPTSEGIWGR